MALRTTDVFWEGIDAAGTGMARSACPYPEDSPLGQEWLDGFDGQTEFNTGDFTEFADAFNSSWEA